MAAKRWNSIVVVIADPFRRRQDALTKAAAIAGRSGAQLTLLSTFMLPSPPTAGSPVTTEDIVALNVADREKRLQRLAAPLGKRGIDVQCVARWDYPAHDAIVRYVLRHSADLVVAESHRHGRMARWILANTDWELIRHCPCPVWFVRSSSLPSRPAVLVAVDPRHTHAKPSGLDNELLRTAATASGLLDGKLHVVHAYEASLSSSGSTLIEPFRVPLSPERPRGFVKATELLVNRLAERHGIDRRARFIREGEPAKVIAGLTQELKTDVLVMGAVSRSSLQRPFIGNTAERVIDHVDCDVLIVKPPGFRTSAPRAAPRLKG